MTTVGYELVHSTFRGESTMPSVNKPVRFEARMRGGEYRYRVCGPIGEYLTEELSEDDLVMHYLEQGTGTLPQNFDFLITAANQNGTTDLRQKFPLDSPWSTLPPAVAPSSAAGPPRPTAKVAPPSAARPPWWKRLFSGGHHA